MKTGSRPLLIFLAAGTQTIRLDLAQANASGHDAEDQRANEYKSRADEQNVHLVSNFQFASISSRRREKP